MTIAVDFDKVVHAYSRGWHNGKIYDGEVQDAFHGLWVLMREDAVFIHTTRSPRQVACWIEKMSGLDGLYCTTRVPRTWWGKRKPFWNKRDILLVTNWKLAANIYIDDLAYTFTSWSDVMKHLGIENTGITD